MVTFLTKSKFVIVFVTLILRKMVVGKFIGPQLETSIRYENNFDIKGIRVQIEIIAAIVY